MAAEGTVANGVDWALLLGVDSRGISADLSMRGPGVALGCRQMRLGETMPAGVAVGSGATGTSTFVVWSLTECTAVDDSVVDGAGTPLVEVLRSRGLGVRILLGVEERPADAPRAVPAGIDLPTSGMIFTVGPEEHTDTGALDL